MKLLDEINEEKFEFEEEKKKKKEKKKVNYKKESMDTISALPVVI